MSHSFSFASTKLRSSKVLYWYEKVQDEEGGYQMHVGMGRYLASLGRSRSSGFPTPHPTNCGGCESWQKKLEPRFEAKDPGVLPITPSAPKFDIIAPAQCLISCEF